MLFKRSFYREVTRLSSFIRLGNILVRTWFVKIATGKMDPKKKMAHCIASKDFFF